MKTGIQSGQICKICLLCWKHSRYIHYKAGKAGNSRETLSYDRLHLTKLVFVTKEHQM